MTDKYRLVGPAYDFMSKLYSGNSIHHCKLAMLNPQNIGKGTRVLIAGAGHGKDAIHAARLGAHVTIIDISPTMLNKFRKALSTLEDARSLSIEMHQGDILKFQARQPYDVVVANFFLNVFDRKTMTKILEHLLSQAKPRGKIIIGDFYPPSGTTVTKSFQNLYWYAAALAFGALAGNAIHMIYDYKNILESMGLKVEKEEVFRWLGIDLYSSIIASK